MHLDAVARQADHALDVVGRSLVSRGSLKTTTSPRSGSLPKMRPENKRRPNGKRIAAVAVGELRDEQVVADQQGRHHRAGRNVEGLEQEGADDERDEQRIDDRLDRLASAMPPAFFVRRAFDHADRLRSHDLPLQGEGQAARRWLARRTEPAGAAHRQGHAAVSYRLRLLPGIAEMITNACASG